MKNRFQSKLFLTIIMTLLIPTLVHAAGTLTPAGSPDQAMRIVDHNLRVVINNGFAQTEVTQTFSNPNASAVEAIYAFPVPKNASLSEMTIITGETEMSGEVVARDEAERIYNEERDSGGDAGLASRESYQRFEFRVANVPPGDQTTVRFVYYQPISIDTGIGRYVYPLEEGGTDEVAESFWTRNDQVEGSFAADISFKSAWPIAELRAPGFENAAAISKVDEQTWHIDIQQAQANLNRDLVVYYRLQDNLPGRVELLTSREDGSKTGTFMMVITPGLDLQAITGGADYVFVLDTSGSMSAKLATLSGGVVRSIQQFNPEDRFRIVTFSNDATEMTGGWVVASPENVQHWAGRLQQLQTSGGTNLHAGLEMALKKLDNDRATSIIMVTDGVTNTGVIDPKAFHQLMQKVDVRVFGFLLGNSANWPLMEIICDASGGFYQTVSNTDDIIGQIMLAKSKIRYEALHDVELSVDGIKVSDITDSCTGKIYRGQQLVVFGRYHGDGPASLRLKASLTGQDKSYNADFAFPRISNEHPEIERLWAMSRIEEIEKLGDIGLMPVNESNDAIRDLGVEYQLVTDETAMLALRDENFEKRGIDRRNRDRIDRERQAQTQRRQQPVKNYRVDEKKPMFEKSSPSLGGGAIDPMTAALALLAGVFCIFAIFRAKAH